MKKILRRVFLSILAVIIIAGAVGGYYLFHGKNPTVSNHPYVTDNEGSSYLAVVGADGTTLAVVTDANGDRYAAQIKADGSIGATLGNVNEQVPADIIPTNYTGPRIDESADPNAFTGNASEIEDTTGANAPTTPDNTTGVTEPSTNNAPTQNGETLPTATTSPTGSQNGGTTQAPATQPGTTAAPQTTAPNKLTAYRIAKYQQIFESGTYLMEFKTNDPDLGDTPITAAMKNGNFIIDTNIQGYTCKMLYLAKDKTTYLIIDDFKKYCKLPEDLMGEEDFDMSSMMSDFASSDISNKEVKVKEVEIGGKKLICESYKLDDGSEARFYFDGETLVRRDNVNTDGTIDSTYISRITSDVPDSTFEIPKKYGYLNLDWLGALAG